MSLGNFQRVAAALHAAPARLKRREGKTRGGNSGVAVTYHFFSGSSHMCAGNERATSATRRARSASRTSPTRLRRAVYSRT